MSDDTKNSGSTDSDSSDEKSFRIAIKLKGASNWNSWSRLIRLRLKRMKLWKVVNGEELPSTKSTRKLENAQYLMLNSMAESQIKEVSGFEDDEPHKVYAALKALHVGRGGIAASDYDRQLVELTRELPSKIAHSEMKQYFDAIKQANDNLKELQSQSQMTQVQLGLRVLTLLQAHDNPRWSAAADRIREGPEEDSHFDKVTTRILDLLGGGRRSEDGSVGPMTLTTTNAFAGKCWRCGKVGHRKSDCKQQKCSNGGKNSYPRANVTISLVTRALTAQNNGAVKSGRRDMVLDHATQTGHMVKHRDMFVAGSYKSIKCGHSIAGFSDVKSKDAVLPKAVGSGTVQLTLANGFKIELKNVQHVPDGIVNLFSVRTALVQLKKAGDQDAKYEVRDRSSKLIRGNGSTLLSASEWGGLYYLDLATEQDFC